MAMKPPKLVQAMRKKIQNSEDRESSGAEESECGGVTGINFPIANKIKLMVRALWRRHFPSDKVKLSRGLGGCTTARASIPAACRPTAHGKK
ncbi:hypothetical protein SCL_2553 [Sulfuricaulis limicola]|uniref:Uncharacterized protein n=1 Tax=Sulfuricaulis limicola TaxID=1620215 RepID=A0A1B4XJ50_9GAMM|nr:hypothetical protein SCL_2553 [Sulfuricaulis limicola]